MEPIQDDQEGEKLDGDKLDLLAALEYAYNHGEADYRPMLERFIDRLVAERDRLRKVLEVRTFYTGDFTIPEALEVIADLQAERDRLQSPDDALALVATERARQHIIHPGRTPSDDIGDGLRLAILVEEVGEVARELHPEGDQQRLLTELVQVAAICCAWVEGIKTTEEAK